MKIGIVDIDTSHPENWIPILRSMDYEVVGVFDGGDIHPRPYVEGFAAKFDLTLYENLDALSDNVDCGIIHSCDWDKHLTKAERFINLDKAVLIDKPIAGNFRDLDRIAAWVRKGARITGGSSLYYCQEVQTARCSAKENNEQLHTIVAGCGVDVFNYGIHAYALACGTFGAGLKSVRCIGQNVQKQVRLEWVDGRAAILVIGDTGTWLPFYATFITDKTATPLTVDSSKIYRALLESVMPYLSGKTAKPLVDFDVLIEAEKAALAAKYSWENGNVEVLIAGLQELNASYDGAIFAAEYRKMKYPK